MLIATAAVGLAGCTAPTSKRADRGQDDPSVSGSWPMPGFDSANTGYNPDANGIGSNAGRRWRTSIDANILSAPTVSGDTAFTGGDTNVYAYDVTNGEIQWVVDVGAKTARFTPVIVEDRIFQGAFSKQGAIVALNRADGEERWRTPVSKPTQLVATDDALFFGETASGRGIVRSLTLSGEPNWTFEAPDSSTSIKASPAVADRVYAAVNHTPAGNAEAMHSLYALSREDGAEQWRCELAGGSQAAPAVGDDRVYVSTNEGTVHAIDTSTGEEDWVFTTDAPIQSSPALLDEALFVGDLDQGFYAIDTADGTKRWEAKANVSNTDPVVTDDTVYVSGGPLYGFDVDDGSTKWSFRADAFSTSLYSPTLVGDALYVGICLKEHPKDPYHNFLYQFTL